MEAPPARPSPTVPLYPARFPPLTVTLYAPVTPVTAVTAVTVAVVPLTAKSAALTPVTTESNCARKIRVSALVVLALGVPRVTAFSRGAVVSTLTVHSREKLLLLVLPLTVTLAIALMT